MMSCAVPVLRSILAKYTSRGKPLRIQCNTSTHGAKVSLYTWALYTLAQNMYLDSNAIYPRTTHAIVFIYTHTCHIAVHVALSSMRAIHKTNRPERCCSDADQNVFVIIVDPLKKDGWADGNQIHRNEFPHDQCSCSRLRVAAASLVTKGSSDVRMLTLKIRAASILNFVIWQSDILRKRSPNCLPWKLSQVVVRSPSAQARRLKRSLTQTQSLIQ